VPLWWAYELWIQNRASSAARRSQHLQTLLHERGLRTQARTVRIRGVRRMQAWPRAWSVTMAATPARMRGSIMLTALAVQPNTRSL